MKKDYVIRVHASYAKHWPDEGGGTLEFSFDYGTQEVGGRDAAQVRERLDGIRLQMEDLLTERWQPCIGIANVDVPAVKIDWQRLDEGMLAILMHDKRYKWDVSVIGEFPDDGEGDDEEEGEIRDMDTGEVIGYAVH